MRFPHSLTRAAQPRRDLAIATSTRAEMHRTCRAPGSFGTHRPPLDPPETRVLALVIALSYAGPRISSPRPDASTRIPRLGRCSVKEFATGHIRNIALVAHHGVGKTSLAESMLYQAKATSRIGRIADGSTMLDHSPEEIARQMTIDLGLAQFEYQGHKINLLDTPGYADFVGDVYSALRVADSAILLLRAAAGVEVGTEVVWEVLKQEKTPLLVVVNMMDKEHANFDAAVASCHDRLGLNAIPAQLPIGEADQFHGVVDLIENKAWTFTGKGADEKSQEVPIPAELKDKAAKARATLLEEAATGDEQLMEKFLSSGDLTVEE